jgi:hypothetical protein
MVAPSGVAVQVPQKVVRRKAKDAMDLYGGVLSCLQHQVLVEVTEGTGTIMATMMTITM